jgi:hypothetical protein
METKYFSLSAVENNVFIKIFQIILGLACFAIAVYWFMFNSRAMNINGTLWITIIFLSVFGLYQILSGIGMTARFIEIGSDKIRFKKYIFRPAVEIPAAAISKIEVRPMNLIFFLKTKKQILLRFGATYFETNEKIKDEILTFSDLNSINAKIIEEKL